MSLIATARRVSRSTCLEELEKERRRAKFNLLSAKEKIKVHKELQDPRKVYKVVGMYLGMKQKKVRDVVMAVFRFGCYHAAKSGSFKLPGIVKLKVTDKPARAASSGVHPITKKPCDFKAKPASKTVRVKPLAKLKRLLDKP